MRRLACLSLTLCLLGFIGDGRADDKPVTPAIPETCTRWFDGCNTCEVDLTGRIKVCTQKACMKERTECAYCMEYAGVYQPGANKRPCPEEARRH
jgi:hypothetical protein